MLALIAAPFQVILGTLFFVSITLLIYAPVLLPLVYLLDWLYISGYLPWDQWRLLYTALFLYVSSILLQVIADNVFGLTYRKITQDPQIEEATADHPNLAWLHQAFEEVKQQFPGEKSARVFYNPSGEINAIAFRDLRHKGVMIYGGLVKTLIEKNAPEQRIAAVKGILAHELSHLTNWDFLSGQYRMALARQFNLHMSIRNKVFQTLWTFLPILLIIGLFIRWGMALIHNLTTGLINLLSSLYRRLDAAVSRAIEFRCDRQAAKAVGWPSIFLGLSSLPIQSRSNMFDSHPDGISRLLYIHRRGGEKSSNQLISGSIAARITALLLFPLLGLLAWWLGELAQVLPAGYFDPSFQFLLGQLIAIPGVETAINFLVQSWLVVINSLQYLVFWLLEESTLLWPLVQSLSYQVWDFLIHFHYNLQTGITDLYLQFLPLLNQWTGWQISLDQSALKWLPLASTLLTELFLIRLFFASLRWIKKTLAWIQQKVFLLRFFVATRLFTRKSAPELDRLLVTAFNENNYSAVIRLIRRGAHPARVQLTSGKSLVEHLHLQGNPAASSLARLLPKEK
ncbi:Zn-dependent protease with chaperone function [Marinospirillum celere]|uniref:Zn-dependent protease with chaperone function n=1 Tax=Marinospirillum celere TaxID=1122252 RepID=A0A1I1JPP3_9GAMM|nr:M48 family metalloprotease [Marinospirillum celere]SFC47863.1 Zn-dependent protease with chaperone function [Marinospirillum celere]